MADPQHVPELDGFDELTVRLYRAGLLLAAVGVSGVGALYLATPFLPGVDVSGLAKLLWLVTVYGVAAAVLHVHLYDKRIRWVIRAAAWLGVVLMLAAATWADPMLVRWTWHAGLGFVFIALSGFALKEQYCFRLPMMRLVPVLLAVSLIPLLAQAQLVAGAMLTVAGLLLFVLAVQKMRMPLHYDVGDKSKYQV